MADERGERRDMVVRLQEADYFDGELWRPAMLPTCAPGYNRPSVELERAGRSSTGLNCLSS